MSITRNLAVAFVFALFVASVYLHTVVTDLDGTMLGGAERGGAGCPAGLCADGTGTVRDYWAAETQGTTAFGWKHDTLNGAPEGVPRAPAIAVANAFQPGLVLALHSFLGWVASWNVFLLLGFAATAAATFALLTELRLSLPAAAFGAYAFAFSPFAFEKALAGQAAFVHAWPFPLVALVYLRVRDSPGRAAAVLLGSAVAAAFYVHTYFGFIALLEVAVLLAVDFLRPAARSIRRRLSHAGLASLAFVVALAPAASFWLLERGAVDRAVSNTSADVERLGASVPAYVLPWHRSAVFGDLTLSLWDPMGSGEPTLFVGYATLFCAAVGLAVARRGFLVVAAAGFALVGFAFSLPRTIDVAGAAVPTPALVVSELFPYIRASARFGVLAGFGVAILAAIGLHALGRRGGRLVPVAALALLVVELTPFGALSHLDASTPPAHAAWLRDAPSGIVATYPTVAAEAPVIRLAEEEFFHQTFHGRPLYALWAGSVGGTREDAIRILSRDIAHPRTPGILAAEGVLYAVVHDEVYRMLGQRPPKPKHAGLEQIASVGGVRIFRVDADPVPLEDELRRRREEVALARGLLAPAAAYTGGFYEAEAFDGEEWRWAGEGAELVVDNPNEERGIFRLEAEAFSARVPRRVRLIDESGDVLAEAGVATSRGRLRLGPFRLPPGRSVLLLSTAPAAERLAPGDHRIASIFLSPLEIQPLADYTRSLRE